MSNNKLPNTTNQTTAYRLPPTAKSKKNNKVSLVKIGDAAQILGVSIDTLRRWEKTGKISAIRTPGGTRLYSLKALRGMVNQPSAVSRQPSDCLKTESETILKTEGLTSEQIKRETVADLLSSQNSHFGNEFSQAQEIVNSALAEKSTQIVTEVSLNSNIKIKKVLLIGLAKAVPALVLILVLTSSALFLAHPQTAKNLTGKILGLAQIPNQLKQQNNKPQAEVLAASTGDKLEINADLTVSGAINGLGLLATDDGFAIAGGNNARVLTVKGGDVTLDQDLSKASSPTFNALNLNTLKLAAASNQISVGSTGTLTWTPTGTQIITLPDATGTVVLNSNTQTLTNKSLSGSSNTFTSIPNSALSNNKITISAGDNLTGGGDINLGGSATLSLKSSIALTAITLGDGTAAAPAYSFTSDTNTGLYRLGADSIGLIVGGSATKGITINSSGYLGVGTITPGGALSVNGGASIGTYSSTAPPGNGLIVSGNVGLGTSAPQGALDVLSGALFVSSGGNVGIGTTVPGYTLETDGTAWLRGSTSATGLFVDSNGNVGVGTTSPVSLFDVNQKFNVLSGGNVGIGTTNPTGKLALAGGNFIHTAGNPILKGTLTDKTNLNYPYSIAIQGKYAYIITANDTADPDFTIVDISNPASPAVVGTIADSDSFSAINSVAVAGNYAYVASGDNTSASNFTVIDISNPASPAVAGTLDDNNIDTQFSIKISGKYAYVVIDNGIAVIDISNPTAPKTVITLDDSTNFPSANSLDLQGNYLYVANNNSIDDNKNFAVVDISNPASPTVVGTSSNNNLKNAYSVAVQGKYAYVASYNSAAGAKNFAVVNISNPTAPSVVATIDDDTNLNLASSISVAGNYAYVVSNNYTADTSNFTVIDISNPTSPTVVGTIDDNTNLYGAFMFAISGKYAYVVNAQDTAGKADLAVLDLSGIDAPTATFGNLLAGSLDVTGNANIDHNLYVGSGLNVGPGGILSQGPVSILSSGTGTLFALDIKNSSGTDLFNVFDNGNIGIGTTAPLSKLGLLGNASIGGTYGNVAAPSNGLIVEGNVGIGTTYPTYKLDVSGTTRLGATQVTGGITASTGSLDIGSSGVRFGTGYFDTIDASNLAGAITGGGTNNASWTINQDNGSDDTETMSLAFERGNTSPNAVLGWDYTNDEFDLNSSLNITGTIASTNGLTLSGFVNDIITPTDEHLSLMPGGSGNVGIGTTNPTGTLVVNNGSNAYSPLIIQDNGSAVLTVADNGTITHTPNTSVTTGTLFSIAAPASTLTGALTGLNINVSGTTPGTQNVTALSTTAFTGGGNGTTNYGLNIGAVTGSGTSTNYGGYIGTVSGGSTNNIGLRITGTTAAAANYGLYVDAAAQNYFAGNVGIGTTAPSAKLDINGALALQGIAAPTTPGLGLGNFYYDTTANKWKISENGNGFVDLAPVVEKGTGAGSIKSVSIKGKGQVTLTNGSSNITGVNTDFTNATVNGLAYWNDMWIVDSSNNVYYFSIDSISDDTHAVASMACTDYGYTCSGANFAGVSGTYDYYLSFNKSSGQNSIALGEDNAATGIQSISLGASNTSSGNNSVTFGTSNTASGVISTAMGNTTTASGDYSTSLGDHTTASGNISTALGSYTTAGSYLSFALGRYNVGGGDASSWVASDPLFEIGIGTAADAKANALTVLKNGNVGIGTTAPLSKLGLLGNASIGGTYGNIAAPSNGLIVEGNVGIGTTSPSFTLETDGTAWLRGSTSTTGLFVASNGNVGVGTTAPLTLFDVNQKLNVLSNGNVGVGTTSPLATLDVNGTLGINSKFQLQYRTDGDFSPGAFNIRNLNLVSNAFTVREDVNRIGIMDEAPTAVLTVSATATADDVFMLSSVYTNDGDIMTVKKNGNVGIGTTSPSFTLETDGTAWLRGSTSTTGLFVASNGNVGVGTTANPLTNLHINNNTAIGFGTMAVGAPANGLAVSGNVGIGTTTSVADSYSESNKSHTYALYSGYRTGYAQSFTAIGGQLSQVKFHLNKSGSPTGNVYVEIYNSTGTYGTNSAPTDSALATSDTIDASTLPVTSTLTTFSFTGSNQIYLTNGTKYVVAIRYIGGDVSNTVDVAADETSPTHSGNYSQYSSSWTGFSSADLVFYVYENGNAAISNLAVVGNATIGASYGSLSAPANGLLVEGNVGIGTSVPLSKLGVLGNSSIGATYGTIAAPTSGLIVEGNVGIGTTASFNGNILSVYQPTGVAGYGIAQLRRDNALDNSSTIGLLLDFNRINSSTPAWSFGVDTSNRGIIATNNSDMRIGATRSGTFYDVMYMLWNDGHTPKDGYIGIGTTAPGSILSVNGGISAGTYSATAAPANGMIISGNVGIGTTNPLAKLEIDGGNILLANTYGLNIKNTTGTATNVASVNAGDNLYLGDGSNNLNDLYITAGSNDDIYFRDTATVNMIIKGSGNVGIGTTAPDASLAFSASHLANNGLKINLYQGTPQGFGTASNIMYAALASSSDRFAIYDTVTKTNELFTVKGNGNVGIGTTNPLSNLHLDSSANTSITIDGGATDDKFITFEDSALAISMGIDGGDNNFYITNGLRDVSSASSRWFTIANSGNVGIGTTAPLSKFATLGNASIGGTYGNIAAPANGMIVEGNVGIGTTSPDKILAVSNATQWSKFTSTLTTSYGLIDITNTTNTLRLGIDSSTGGSLTTGSTAYNSVVGSTGNYGLQLITNNLVRETIDNNGNIGIGTTSPGAKLDILQPWANTTLRLGDVVTNTTEKLGRVSLRHYTNSEEDVTLIMGSSDGTNNTVKVGGGTAYGNTATILSFLTAANVTTTTGTERMRIDSAGNVGIGTTGPGRLFDILSSSDYYARIKTSNTNGQTGLSIENDAQEWRTYISNTDSFTISDQTGSATYPFIIEADASSNSLRIKSSGNVGIATDSPLSKLGVVGNGAIGATYGTVSAPTSGLIVEGNVGIGTTAPGQLLEVNSSQTTAYTGAALENIAAMITNPNTGGNYSTGIRFQSQGSGAQAAIGSLNLLATGSGSGAFTFVTRNGGTYGEKLRIAADGNVGIGTTNPLTKLYVNSGVVYNAALSGAQFMMNSNGTNVGTIQSDAADVWSLGTKTAVDATTGTPVLSWTKGGNVGIGTTVPAAKLNIYDVTSPTLSLVAGGSNPANGGTIELLETDPNNTGFGTTSTFGFRLAYDGSDNFFKIRSGNETTATDRLVIARDTGNVGIGTTSPGKTLEVSGSILTSNNTGFWSRDTGNGPAQLLWTGSDNNTYLQAGNQRNIWMQINSSTKMAVDQYGNVGIGTTAPISKFGVLGNASIGATYGNIAAPANGMIVEGNVGIGTTAPLAKLEVTGNIILSSGGDRIISQGTADAADSRAISLAGGGTTGVTRGGWIDIYGNEYTNYAGSLFLQAGNPGTTGTYDGKIAFQTGASGVDVLIDTNGNVGIGTTNPGSKLTVFDATNLNDGSSYAARKAPFFITSDGSAGMLMDTNQIETTSTLYVNLSSGQDVNLGATGTLYVKNGGNVGVGTTSPGSLFDVNSKLNVLSGGNIGIGTTNPLYKLEVNGDIGFTGSNSLKWDADTYIYGGADDQINMKVGGNQALRINSVGNVGIGTTVAPQALSIASAAQNQLELSTTGATAKSYFNIDAAGIAYWDVNRRTVDGTFGNTSATHSRITMSTANAAGYIAFSTTNTNNTLASEAMRIVGTGNVGIGTTAPAYKLDIASTAATGSDFRLANNSLNTGNMAYLSSTSTALTTGGLMALDWSPTGSTEIYATGDLFSINAGTYANVGNLLNIKDDGTSIFSISQTAVTTSLPTSFNAAGDVSIAYDLNFTNPTTSNIKSQAPISITAGESFNSSDLSLNTYNAGSVIVSQNNNPTAAGTSYALQILPTLTSSTNSMTYTALYGNYNIADVNLSGDAATDLTTLYSNYTGLTATAGTIGTWYGDYIAAPTGSGTVTNKYALVTESGAGNVGIGTTASTLSRMTVSGLGTGAGLSFLTTDSAGTNRFAIQDNGNVGIGTTNPASKFEIQQAADNNLGGLRLVNAGNGTSGRIWIDAGNAFRIDNGATATGIISLNGAGTGNVGIGTTAPTALLDINGSANFKANTYQYIGGAKAFAGDGSTLNYAYSGSNAFRVLSNADANLVTVLNGGNVGIGTTSPAHKLDVVGTAGLSTGTLWTNTSDSRVKQNIETIPDALGIIDQLKPSQYLYTPEYLAAHPEIKNVEHFGFIAQDFQEVFPDWVTTGADGYLQVNASNVIPYAVKAIQEQQAQISSLQSSVFSLQTNDATSSAAIADLQSKTVNHELITVNSSGNIGIGTTDPGAYKLYVDGPGYLADTGWTYASDRRLKENISSIDSASALNIVEGLNPVTFDYINGGKYRSGFIAQDVQQILPSLVTQRPDGMLSIRTDEILPYTVKAIQELNAQIASMKDSLKIDGDGTLNVAAIKTDKLLISTQLSDISLQTNGSSLTTVETTTDSSTYEQPATQSQYVDLAGRITERDQYYVSSIKGLEDKVKELEDKVTTLSTQVAGESTSSAQIATDSAQPATSSSQLTAYSLQPESSSSATTSALAQTSGVNDLNLTPPEVLLTNTSANLVDLSVTSEATFSGQLRAYEATIADSFTSLGNTTLGTTTVAGDLSVDGTMSITGNSINTLGNSSNLGILYIQNNPLANVVDFFNGAVTIDKTGTLAVKKIELPAEVLGEAIIVRGQLDIPILTNAVTAKSKVFLTPLTRLGGQTLTISGIVPGFGFVVTLESPINSDTKFNWVIIDNK